MKETWLVYRGKHLKSFVKVYRLLKNGYVDGRQWHYRLKEKWWIPVGRIQISYFTLDCWKTPNQRELKLVSKKS
jgi:hypothetical protein